MGPDHCSVGIDRAEHRKFRISGRKPSLGMTELRCEELRHGHETDHQEIEGHVTLHRALHRSVGVTLYATTGARRPCRNVSLKPDAE